MILIVEASRWPVYSPAGFEGIAIFTVGTVNSQGEQQTASKTARPT
jgi:hypothetical protein